MPDKGVIYSLSVAPLSVERPPPMQPATVHVLDFS